MAKYSVSLHGFLTWHAEVFDEKNILLTKGELTRSVVHFSFPTKRCQFTMTRHGAIRRWYQLLDKKGTPLCYSLPAISPLSLTLYDKSKAIRWKVNRQFERLPSHFQTNYILLDGNDLGIAWIRSISEGMSSQKSLLQIEKSPSEREEEIIAVAVGLLLFDYRDIARASIGG